MDIPRFIGKTIGQQLGKQKVLLLYGTRRVGKTKLIKNIAEKHRSDVLLLQGVDMQVGEAIQTGRTARP